MKKQYIVRLKSPDSEEAVSEFLERLAVSEKRKSSSTRFIKEDVERDKSNMSLNADEYECLSGLDENSDAKKLTDPVNRKKYKRPPVSTEIISAPDSLDCKRLLIELDESVVEELMKLESGVEFKENVGLNIPEPISMELMAGEAGTASPPSSGYYRKILGVDDVLHRDADGSGIKVSIIDSGIYRHHDEFKGTSFFESWDYYELRPKKGDPTYVFLPAESKYEPGNYHGTAVAGMLCGRHSGVAPGVMLIVHNVFYQQKAQQEANLLTRRKDGVHKRPETDLLRVEMALNRSYHKTVNADIILMSMGRSGYDPCFIEELPSDRLSSTLVVAAIGNDGSQTHYSPADYEHVLSVGGTDENDNVWHNTETGKGSAGNIISNGNASYRVPVIYAPGVNMRLPVPAHIDPTGYIVRSGTSFAAPLVAGVAALVMGWYKQRNKTIRANDVKEHLCETADSIELPAQLGASGLRVNAAAAVNTLKEVFPVS